MSELIKVWLTFSVSKDDGVVNFKIVDVPPDRVEELADLMINYFAPEETTFRLVGVSEDEQALKECREIIIDLLSCGIYHGTVCCVDNGDDTIGDFVGASIMTLTTIDNRFEFKPQSKTLQEMIKLSKSMDSLYDPRIIHGLDKYYEDRGVVVHPDFRGKGVAQQLFKVRRLICKEHGVPMTGAWMTSYGTHKAAERDGWEIKYKLDNEELKTRFGLTFEPPSPPFILFMIANI